MRDKTINTDENQLRGDIFKALQAIVGDKTSPYDLSKLYIQDNKLKAANNYLFAEVEFPLVTDDCYIVCPDVMPYKRTGKLSKEGNKLIYEQDERKVEFAIKDIKGIALPFFNSVMRDDSSRTIKFRVDLMRKVLDIVEATGHQFFELHYYGRSQPVKIKSSNSDYADILDYCVMLAPAV